MTNAEFYKFDKDHAFSFANAIGAKYREEWKELKFMYCPYCNGGSNKDKRTFSISLETGMFECKRASCGAKGNMITLAKDFADFFHLPREIDTYYRISPADNYKRWKNAKRITESKDAAVRYMASRGISEAVTRQYEITVKADDENILVFPFKDENGELQFIKYRNLNFRKGESQGSKEWCEKNCKPILFGMNHCKDFGTLVVTEGQIDSLSCAEAGIKNAVSVPTGKNGFTWKPHCWNWMTKFDEVVVFGDNENGEITLAKEIGSFFPKTVRIVRTEDYHGFKDANDLLMAEGPEALVNAVKNAEPKISEAIKDLSVIEAKDFSKLPTIKSGVDRLDESLGGGFHFGELIVLTGKCGEGKSTFASMCVAYALKQGFNCFCYSGELAGFMFKNWLDTQIAGKSNLKNGEIERINDWYRKRIYIYDNTAMLDEPFTPEDAIKEAIKNLNCKFILLDNLMTAMSSDVNLDLYRQQSDFVKRMAYMAKAYDVTIMLVAHPRKGNGTSNDDISGSGDITNLATVVLRYQRSKEEGISLLSVTKNRNTGKLMTEDNAVKMEFHEESRRITEYGARPVSFIEDSAEIETFTEVSIDEEIPFD